MTKCLLVTYSLMTGSVVEYTGSFTNCDTASEFVRLFNQNNTEQLQVIALNPKDESEDE